MIESLLTTFGIGYAAGNRAGVAALGLGVLHWTPYFELGGKWLWLASPPVMVLLLVVTALEIAADRFQESAELVALASWLPKAIVAFVGVAATMGTVDASVVSLVTSGLLGAATAVATDRVKVVARRRTAELADAGVETADDAAHHLETAVAAGALAAALLQPWLVVVVLFLAVAAGAIVYVLSRGALRGVRRVAGLRTGEEPDPDGGT